ncbi:hypothetical protein [Caldilinea sp.]|uniref:hypothetical protein n=1 Tax=Caldilinea sp. TaxID=2293560 RepID=UPI002CC9A655|nr:hypothetical protein [Anaerolineales bacterium]HQY93804.1 hypothetical protein [Caldilinea sp.]
MSKLNDIKRCNAMNVQRWSLPVRILLLIIVVYTVAACGGEDAPPEPTATATPASPAPEAITPLSEETLPVSADAPVQAAALPAATPTVSVLAVDESEGQCSIDYDIDLAGYPDLYRKLGCAVSASSNEAVGINEFGEGPEYSRFMLWFGNEQQIYVLFPDQSWQSYRDTWDENQPEFSCNPLSAPPSSPPLPRRGFGKLWCSVEGLQEQLGMIDREERLCQHTVVQSFEQGRLLACFEDATIRYFNLLNDGAWELLVVQ